MSGADMQDDFGSTIEEVEARKRKALEDITRMELEIERLKAEEEYKRDIELRGLFEHAFSVVKTTGSSFSDGSIGEFYESNYGDVRCAESYSRTIDVELSARYVNDHEETAYVGKIEDLEDKSSYENPTLAVTFLIPYDMISDAEFFR